MEKNLTLIGGSNHGMLNMSLYHTFRCQVNSQADPATFHHARQLRMMLSWTVFFTIKLSPKLCCRLVQLHCSPRLSPWLLHRTGTLFRQWTTWTCLQYYLRLLPHLTFLNHQVRVVHRHLQGKAQLTSRCHLIRLYLPSPGSTSSINLGRSWLFLCDPYDEKSRDSSLNQGEKSLVQG